MAELKKSILVLVGLIALVVGTVYVANSPSVSVEWSLFLAFVPLSVALLAFAVVGSIVAPEKFMWTAPLGYRNLVKSEFTRAEYESIIGSWARVHVVSSHILAAAAYGLILSWIYGEIGHDLSSRAALITALSVFSAVVYPCVLVLALNLVGSVLAIMHGNQHR